MKSLPIRIYNITATIHITTGNASTSLRYDNITAMFASTTPKYLNSSTSTYNFTTSSKYLNVFQTPWSTCSLTATYATNYPVTLRSLSPECDIGDSIEDMMADIWGNYDFVDRCLARWCKSSWYDAVDAYTSPLTEVITTMVTWLDLDFEYVYKTTSVPENESPWEYIKWIVGDYHSSTLICA
jgi:hypothetical protein